jgi:hypothetical protein
MNRSWTVAACLMAACSESGPASVSLPPTPSVSAAAGSPSPLPSPSSPRITDFSWRNNTVTLACENLLTGADAAAIRCASDTAVPVRIRVTDLEGNCRSGGFPYGARCQTTDGTQAVTAYWEAPWDFGSTWTAMTGVVTCEVLDASGQVVDSRSTCIPSTGYTNRDHISPPWSDDCQKMIIGCHYPPP